MSMSYYDLHQRLQQQQRPPSDPVLDAMGMIGNAPVLGGVLGAAGGLMGAAMNVPGVKGAMDAISYPGQVIRGTLLHDQLAGNVAHLGGPLSPLTDLLQSSAQGLMGLGADTVRYGPLGAMGAAHDRWEDLPMSGAKILNDIVVDPLNLVGTGAAANLAKSAGGEATRIGRALGKAASAEQAGQELTSQMVRSGFGKAEDLAKAGLQQAGKIHPWFGTLLDESPQARVALETSRLEQLINGVRGFMDEDQGVRTLAHLGLDPSTKEFQTAHGAVKNRIEQILQDVGAPFGTPIDPNDYLATLYSKLPDYESGYHRTIGPQLANYLQHYDRDMTQVRSLVNNSGAFPVRPNSMDEAIKFAERAGNAGDAAVLKGYQKRWRGTDLLAADEDTAIVNRYLRQYSRDQGLGDPLKLRNLPGGDQLPPWAQDIEPGTAWREGLTAWRQQALLWPSYWLNNLKDIEFKSLANGLGKGIDDLGHNLSGVAGKLINQHPEWQSTIERGLGPARMKRWQDAATSLGPVMQGFLNDVELKHLPPDILQGGLSNELGGLKAATDTREVQGIERLPKIGRAIQFVRELSEALELSARGAAFRGKYLGHLGEEAENTASRLGMIAEQVSPSAAEAIRNHVLSNDGVVAPQKVASWFAAQGADPNIIGEAMREVGNISTDAYRFGVNEANRIHIDYRRTTNLDQGLRNVTGFHFWATRNIPQYTEIMATHPGVWLALQRMEDDVEDYRGEHKIGSPRLQDSVPLDGLGRSLAGVLFGRNGQLFVDPKALTGVGAGVGDVRAPSKGEGPVGQALDVAAGYGVSPHPLLQSILEMSGVYGARQPGNVLRATSVINPAVQAATGQQFDLEAPIKAVRRSRPLGGEAPAPPEDQVKWRLRELSQELTGHAESPAFKEAIQTGPSHPLWRMAVQDLGDVALRERLLAAVGVPAKFYSEGQAGLDARRRA